MNDQAGQLKVLVSFVQTALNDRIDGRAEKAVVNVLSRLAAVSDETDPTNVGDTDR